MSFELDLSDDFEVFDGKQSIRYKVRQAGNTFDTVIIIDNALRRSISQNLIARSGGLLSNRDTFWHIPEDALDPVVPKPQDVIEETNGVRWSVKANGVETLGTRYRLTCQREVP